MKMKITHDSYSFVENASSQDEWHVKIKEGDYKGIVYKYGVIEIIEPEHEADEARLKYQFKVVHLPQSLDFTEEDLNQDVEFLNLLGDILLHIVEDAMENNKYKLGNNDKPTDSESTVH